MELKGVRRNDTAFDGEGGVMAEGGGASVRMETTWGCEGEAERRW